MLCIGLLIIMTGCQNHSSPSQENSNDLSAQADVSETKLNADNFANSDDAPPSDTTESDPIENQSSQDNVPSTEVNLHDESAILAYFYDYYIQTLEADLTPIDYDYFAQSTTLIYDDFNNDGQEDVVCYSESPTSTYLTIAFITIKDQALTLIHTDMAPEFVYEQAIQKEGNFVIRKLRGGGTGISSTTLSIYGLVKGSILYTGTRIQTEGYENIIPNDKNIEELSHSFSSETNDMSYKIGTDEDQWLMFSHKDIIKDDLTETFIYEKVTEYTYQPENNRYYQNVISEEGQAGAFPPAYLREDHYDANDLRGGSKIGDFNILSAIYNPSENSTFIFEGTKTIEGNLCYDNEMNDDYYFESDQALLDNPLWIPIEDGQGNVQDTLIFDHLKMAWFSNDISSFLTPEIRKSLNRPPYSTRVSVTLSRFSIGCSAGSESGENITITDVKRLN